MRIEGIKYIGPLFDGSGYAQAARSYVIALHKLGVPVTLGPVAFEKAQPRMKPEEERILRSLLHKPINYNIVIIHLTPEFWPGHVELDKINVGYTVWETSLLHKDWPGYMNYADFILCPCQWNREVFIKSGVNKPIEIIPHIIDVSEYDDIRPFKVVGVKEDAYKFYSICQFTERKHPSALLRAYWAAFHKGENVALILKTYKNDYSDAEKESIRNYVRSLKSEIVLEKYPPVYLVLDMLNREDLLGLHAFGDCLVSLDRGEGFGLVPFEAGAAGKPIIITGMGGALEYARPTNSFLVNYTMTPVFGMPWSPWYKGNQMWAEPDLGNAIELMRYVYNNQPLAIEVGQTLRKYIEENFSWSVVGGKIIHTLRNM